MRDLMKLFDLHDLPGPHPDCPDPVHNERDLWLGIDVAERFLGFSLEDISLVFRHARPTVIGLFCAIGAQLDDRTLDNPKPGAHWAQLSRGRTANTSTRWWAAFAVF
jgi:hypothetical protein